MPEAQLDRIEAKLDRLQAMLDRAGPLGPLIDALPDLVATVGNTVDDLAARDGHARMDQRLRRVAAVLVKLSEPQLLAGLERLLGHSDALFELADELPPAVVAPAEDHGVFGLLAVLREDEVQRALSFLIHFTRRLGRLLAEHDRS